MRPIFVGNLEFEFRQSDIERLFRRYGRIERVDMKSEQTLKLIAIHVGLADGNKSSSLVQDSEFIVEQLPLCSNPTLGLHRKNDQ